MNYKQFLQSTSSDSLVKLSRSTISISGSDSVKFLQGLTTNSMLKIEKGGDGILSAFLSPQGRMLTDVFIYPRMTSSIPSFIIDCSPSHASALECHLQKFILRNKITLSRSDLDVYAAWGPSTLNLWGNYVPSHAKNLPPGSIVPRNGFMEIGCRDPRHVSLGIRFLAPNTWIKSSLPLPDTFKEKNEKEYHARRILLGIPQGPQDIQWGTSLPLESNLDYMQGVDFRKGCYVGQELTIRTYHTGVTRKRIVPVMYYKEQAVCPNELEIDVNCMDLGIPEPFTDVYNVSSKNGKGVGKVGGHVYNVGLALLRLDQVGKEIETKDGMKLKGFTPDWWPKPLGFHTA